MSVQLHGCGEIDGDMLILLYDTCISTQSCSMHVMDFVER
jgi:hypothetical protein